MFFQLIENAKRYIRATVIVFLSFRYHRLNASPRETAKIAIISHSLFICTSVSYWDNYNSVLMKYSILFYCIMYMIVNMQCMQAVFDYCFKQNVNCEEQLSIQPIEMKSEKKSEKKSIESVA